MGLPVRVHDADSVPVSEVKQGGGGQKCTTALRPVDAGLSANALSKDARDGPKGRRTLRLENRKCEKRCQGPIFNTQR